MNRGIQQYHEPLNEKELGFLKKKEGDQRKVYYRLFRIMMIVSFVVPYLAAWYRVADGAPNAFSYGKFFVSAGILLFISCFSTYITYRLNLRKIQWDIKYRSKTVDTNHITRKLFVPTNNTYYFYIDSPVKLSIEVTETDYYKLKEGDELNIEYSTYSREFLGYF